MLYLLFAIVSGIGLVASAVCHILSWLSVDVPSAAFVLHVAIFAIWLPLIHFANRTKPKTGRGNVDHLLAELPSWVNVAVGVALAYAILNFAWFMFASSQFPKNGVPKYVELRGFSGHWMMFYGWGLAGFAGLARREQRIAKASPWL